MEKNETAANTLTTAVKLTTAIYAAVQSLKTAFALFTREQILPFAFAEKYISKKKMASKKSSITRKTPTLELEDIRFVNNNSTIANRKTFIQILMSLLL